MIMLKICRRNHIDVCSHTCLIPTVPLTNMNSCAVSEHLACYVMRSPQGIEQPPIKLKRVISDWTCFAFTDTVKPSEGSLHF
jgi:hypothetical protein